MKNLLCTISNEEDSFGVDIKGQVLYFYDDGTYNGVINYDYVIDMTIYYSWKIDEKGQAWFKPSMVSSNFSPFSSLSSSLLSQKITEYYLLKETQHE